MLLLFPRITEYDDAAVAIALDIVCNKKQIFGDKLCLLRACIELDFKVLLTNSITVPLKIQLEIHKPQSLLG